MPAKVVNDDAIQQDKRGAFEIFAGKPAPTGGGFSAFDLAVAVAFDLDLLPLSKKPVSEQSPEPLTP